MAEPGTNEARLTWTPAPAREPVGEDPGVAEPTWFGVVVRQGGDTRMVRVEAPTTGTVVSGLRNGVEAFFEVYSVTEDGSSEPTGPVTATPVTGMEGEVAGLVVAFEPGVQVVEGQEVVPGEQRVASVDLSVEGALSNEATLVSLSDAVSVREAEAIAAELSADPAVAWAEPDRFIFTASDQGPIGQAVSVPDDARYTSDQWNLWDAYGIGIGDGSSSMTSAWAHGTGDGTTVAVIDTGITAHPDLDSQLVPGFDFVSDPAQLAASRKERAPPVAFDADAEDPARYGVAGWDDNPTDPGDWRGVAPSRNSTWHGTMVAGVIAAQARNGVGVAGVAPGVRIQPIRALSWRGGLLSDVAASITWASGGPVDGAPHNAHPSGVINLSLAAEVACPTALQDAIDGARSRGSVIIAAAGNANDDAEKFAPGNCNGVITVAATDRSGNRAPYSNFGARIDVSAPGGNAPVDGGILTTSNAGSSDPAQTTWTSDQGTSFAAAHVAAAAAILKGRDATLTPDAVERQLTGTVRSFAGSTCDADPSVDCGTGILTLAQVAADPCTTSVGSSGGYRTETLTAFFLTGCSGTWTPPSKVTAVDVLVVGGGGGGGAWVGGGGGGGGVTELLNQSVSGGVSVVVGGAGTGATCNGTSLTNFCTTNNTNNLLSPVATAGGSSSFGAVSATGGGAGGSSSAQQPSGGANGGGGGNGAGGVGSVSGSGAVGGKVGGAACNYCGSNGFYFGGGGAGAGSGGADATSVGAGVGGNGHTSTITGLTYGGGGGGGAHNTASAAAGGSGGGGSGNNFSGGSYNGASGTNGTGGGGGGGGFPNNGYSSGGYGGQGTVVIRYFDKWTSLSSQPSNYNAAGWLSQAPVVQLVDYNGTALTGVSYAGITVTASFTASSGAVTLSNATATTNSSGVATFTSLALSGAVGSAGTLTFSASGYGPITSSSVAIVAGPATAAQSTVSVSPSSVTADGSTSSTVTVTAKDANGNGVPSQSIFFAISSGTGTLSSGPWTTNGSGLVTATVSSTTAGSVTVRAYLGTSASGTLITQSGSVTFTAGAATAAQSTVSVSPSSVTADGSTSSTVTVTAKDANGNGVPSQSIFFAISSGTGTLSSGPWTTNGSGLVTATVSSTTAGSVTVRAYLGTSASGTLITQSGSVTFTAGPASKLVVSSIASQVAGTGFDVTVTLTDTYGNSVNNTGAVGTVTLTRASGAGTVGGTTTGTIAVGSSAVTISGVTYTAAESGVSLTATGTGSSSLVNGKTGTSNTFTVGAGSASKLVITGSASQTAGAAQSVTITAQDANGNTATSYTGDKSITFSGAASSADGNAPSVVDRSGTTVVFGTATTITFTNGVASVAASKNGVMTLYKAESALVSVSDGTLSSSGAGRLSVTVSATSASKLGMETQPAAGASGAALSTQPAVRILDQYGNLTTSTATVTVSASAGTLGGSEASAGKAAVGGVATFTNLTFAALTSVSATLTFSSGSLTPVTSASIQATGPGAAAMIAVSAGNGQSATAGSAVGTAPAVRVTDAAGNPVSGVSVTFVVATGGGSLASSGTAATNVTGIATSPAWTLGSAAGSNALTATSSSLSGSPVTFTATGTVGPATKLQVLLPGETAAPGTGSGKAGSPTAQTAGASFTVTVNAVDANWNVVSSATPTVAITSSDANAILSANAALVSGTKTFSVTAKTAGSATVTATDQAGSPLTASTSASVTVNAGTASKLQVLLPGETAAPGTGSGKAGSPTAQTSGSSFTVTVNAVDANWNVVAFATPTVAISSTDANATLPTSAALVSGTRAFAVTAKTAGTATVTATDQAGSGPLAPGTSASVSVNPGAAAMLVIATQPTAGASGSVLPTQPVIRVADANGNTVTSFSASVTVTASGGILDGTTTRAAASGIVTYSGLSFAGLAGTSYTLTFASSSLASVTSSSLTPTGAGTAASIAVNAGGGQTATMDAAVATAPSVIVKDSGGNPVAGTSVTFAVVSGGGSLASPGSPATVSTNASGIATAPTWTLGTAVGANALTASSGSLTGSPVSFSATATARPITITASDETITFGGTLSPAYTLSAGRLGGSDAISSMTYSYTGTGLTVYGPSTTPPTGGGTYSVMPSVVVFSPGSAANYTIGYQPGVVTIAKATQAIMFAQPSAKTYLDAPFALAPTSDSGLAVVLDTNAPSVCTVASNIVTIVGAGTCSLTATQAGNANYHAAPPVTRTFTVAQAAQAALSVTSASRMLFGQAYTVTAAGGSGSGVLTYLPGTDFPGSAGCSITTGTGVLTYASAGTCEVKVRRAASTNFLVTTSADFEVAIDRAGQTLAFISSVPASPLPWGTYVPSASAVSTVTGESSGIAPSFMASGTCTMAGGTVTFTSTGTCTVTASAGATSNFTVATPVTQVIAVGSLNQTIGFPQPSNVSFGSSGFAAGASSTSGLTVTYALGAGTTNAACSVSSLGAVTVLAVGTCEIVASQSGDAAYAAASDVTRAFQVVPALATAPTLTSASASSQSITVGISPPGFTGGVAVTGYRIEATPTAGGPPITSTSCTTSPCTITGLTNGSEYTVTVAAINSAGTGPASGASTPLTPATAAYAVGALSATPGSTTVDLSWIPLTTDQLGGGSFTRYEISKRVVGTLPWELVTASLTSPSTSTYSVTGLSNGTSYDFQVAAITTANSGEIPGNTAQVVQYPSTVPSAPRSPVVLASTATSVQFSWAAPLSDGGSALTNPNYAVTVTSPTSGATAVSCVSGGSPPGSARTCTASGLTNGAAYTFAVVATNRMGAGLAATTTYNVPSSITTLSSLVVTGADGAAIDLVPSFDPDTRSYAATVSFPVTAITVTPTTTDAAASVSVDGTPVVSGASSAPITLPVGDSVVDLVVTASDPRYTGAYQVTVTRLPAPGAADTDGPEQTTEARNARLQPIPVPAGVSSGSAVGAVTVDGIAVDTSFVRNGTDSGWIARAPGFELSVAAVGPAGQPVPLGSNGVLILSREGWLEIAGSGYDPGTPLRAFTIAMTETPAGATRERALEGATYLGSLSVDDAGTVRGRLALSAALEPGSFVLQLNGFATSDEVRSVSMRMDVLRPTVVVAPEPTPPALRTGSVLRSAFFDARSARLTSDGQRKVAALANAVPRGATKVRVSVVAVSVGMNSVEANLSLARDRAVAMVKELRARGIAGEYAVSIWTPFTVDGDERVGSAMAGRSGPSSTAPSGLGEIQPSVSDAGQPLTTVKISYVAPWERA